MIGLSTIGRISLGWAFVAGKNRVPNPAAGITTFLTFLAIENLLIIDQDLMITCGEARPLAARRRDYYFPYFLCHGITDIMAPEALKSNFQPINNLTPKQYDNLPLLSEIGTI